MRANGLRMLMWLLVLVQLMALFQYQVMGRSWRDGFTVAAICAVTGLCAARFGGRRAGSGGRRSQLHRAR